MDESFPKPGSGAKEASSDFYLGLLARLGNITEEDINRFVAQRIPNVEAKFRKLKPQTQAAVAALGQLSQLEYEKFLSLGDDLEDAYMVGLHEIGQPAAILQSLLTQEENYKTTDVEWNIFLLGKVAEVTDKQLEDFGNTIIVSDKQKMWHEELDSERKRRLFVLYSLTDKEILGLLKYVKEKKAKGEDVEFVGFHDVFTDLLFLFREYHPLTKRRIIWPKELR